LACTTTVGGTTSGYSLIGSLNTAIEPVITNSSDSTAAMIGRSTKNWAMFFMQWILDKARFAASVFLCSSPCSAGGGWEGVTLLIFASWLAGGLHPSPALPCCTSRKGTSFGRRGGSACSTLRSLGGRRSVMRGTRIRIRHIAPLDQRLVAGIQPVAHRHLLRIHLDPGAHALQAVHHHQVVRLQATVDHAQAVEQGAGVHLAVLHLVFLVDHIDELVAQIGADGAVVDQDARPCLPALQLHAGVQAGGVEPVGVVEHRAQADRAGAGVQLVVDEVEAAP